MGWVREGKERLERDYEEKYKKYKKSLSLKLAKPKGRVQNDTL